MFVDSYSSPSDYESQPVGLIILFVVLNICFLLCLVCDFFICVFNLGMGS